MLEVASSGWASAMTWAVAPPGCENTTHLFNEFPRRLPRICRAGDLAADRHEQAQAIPRRPALRAASRSPPCAPTPGASIHSSGSTLRTAASASGCVALTTSPRLSFTFQPQRQFGHPLEEALRRNPTGQRQVLQVAGAGVRGLAQQKTPPPDCQERLQAVATQVRA